MILAVFVAWAHYIGIMLLIASLLGEHLVLKREMTTSGARTLRTLDSIYGASAGVVLVTGIWRMFLEKGAAYYLHNMAWNVLVGLFVLIALLSLYPTVVFLRFRRALRAGTTPTLEERQFRTVQMIIRLELLLILIAPLFATWMAHGQL